MLRWQDDLSAEHLTSLTASIRWDMRDCDSQAMSEATVDCIAMSKQKRRMREAGEREEVKMQYSGKTIDPGRERVNHGVPVEPWNLE